jgi:hypothetical protein
MQLKKAKYKIPRTNFSDCLEAKKTMVKACRSQ